MKKNSIFFWEDQDNGGWSAYAVLDKAGEQISEAQIFKGSIFEICNQCQDLEALRGEDPKVVFRLIPNVCLEVLLSDLKELEETGILSFKSQVRDLSISIDLRLKTKDK